MWRSRIAWTCWALIPVAGLAYHFGPGQKPYLQDVAGGVIVKAKAFERDAQAAQEAAYAAHLRAIEERRAAFLSQSPEDAAKAKAASADEAKAYAAAADAWRVVADELNKAQGLLVKHPSEATDQVRCAKGRALIRSGQINSGLAELEALVDEHEESGKDATDLARDAREELATGYYYNARILRLSGAKAEEWREYSGKARQNFRYLAESARNTGADRAVVDQLQNDVEVVLNLEQGKLDDLQAKPLPKNSPQGNCQCDKPGKKPGKKPNGKKNDARNGAGDMPEMGGGW